ncbi:MAG: FAD-dependent oxidoreductase [Candidatus Obscuribacterales bacterium]|nr:FAD-dependent oxidoreductase [Steroidobacteraceae bacterium]
MWPFSHHDAEQIRSSEPYWLLRNGIGDATPSLSSSIECEIAVVGAGITGALVADELTRGGHEVVVLDKLDCALGSTSASTALLQYEIDTHLVDLIPRLGWDQAALAYRAGVSSIEMLESLTRELGVEVNFERRSSVYLAAADSDVPVLREELAARQKAGIDVRWTDSVELQERFKCHRPGALLSAVGAQVDPFRLTRGLLDRCQKRGARLFARTAVEALDDSAIGVLLRTATGHEIRAQHVVICAGYESLRFLPSKVADLFSTFAVVTEPITLTGEQRPLMWESARPYLYIRDTPDGRLLIGGQDIPFNNSSIRQALLDTQARKLIRQYEELFKTTAPRLAYAWAGTFGATADGLPHIGRAPNMNDRVLFALCFGGNGITYSAHAGTILRASIEGVAHPLQAVFGFNRLTG